MPPPSDHDCLNLKIHPKLFFVKQLPSSGDVPPNVLQALNSRQGFFSVTRAQDEVSIVGEIVDSNPFGLIDGAWRCIQIAGPMDFDLTGVVCSFTTPLKEAGIPVYVVSTWNTDFVLVPKERFEQAVLALKTHGWKFLD